MTWYDMMRYDMTWYDMIWCEVIWYSIISSDDLSLNTYSLTYFYNMHTLIWCTSSKGNLLNSYSETFQISLECSRRISEYFTLYHSISISSLPSEPSLLFILIFYYLILTDLYFNPLRLKAMSGGRRALMLLLLAWDGFLSPVSTYVAGYVMAACWDPVCVDWSLCVCVWMWMRCLLQYWDSVWWWLSRISIVLLISKLSENEEEKEIKNDDDKGKG